MEPTIACQTTILCIVVGMLLTTTVIEAQQFTIEPESVVQAEGLLAEFECLSPGALAHGWFVNGIASTSLISEIRVAGGNLGRPSVLTIPASSQFNNSVVQCVAFSVSDVVFSRNATLTVERVILEVLNGETKITVSVMNNFTMNNLTFRVDISLVPVVTNEMVVLPPLNGIQNQVQFNYQQLKNHTVCDLFSFTVTPISESGMEGRSSEPVTGFFTRVTDNTNVAPFISQGGNVLRKIVHLGGMVPNCTSFTSYQVTSDSLSAPINKTIEDPQMINVSLPTDRIINISVTLNSIMGVRLIFKDVLIRTNDVQNLSVNVCPEGNCARIEYVEGTISPGALVCVIGVLSNNSLDLESIRLLPIRRNMSDNFTIPVAVSGNYSVVAFDLENNNISVPRMPMSVAADNETMFLSNESSTVPNSPPNPEGITVTKLSNGNVEVTCNTSGQSCLALFQSTTSLTSLDPMVMIGLLEPPNNKTNVNLSTTSDVYVVVYTWNSDSGETIFDGKVSFISQLELPTSPPPTQSPPDSTGSPAPSSSPQPQSPIVIIVIVVTLILVIAITFMIVVIVVLKRYKRGNKVYIHRQLESNSQGISTNTASQKLVMGASITSQKEVIALYDVACRENMSPECNTADTDATPPPGYDVVCKKAMIAAQNVGASSQVVFYVATRSENMSLECITADTDDTLPPGYDVVRAENMPSPEYETIASAKAGKPTPTTSKNPPPLPHPMIKGDEGLDNDGVLTEETTDSTAQAKDEPTEDGGDGGLETKIAAQHQYMLVEHKPSDKVIMKDSSKVIYSEVNKDKLKPVVPPSGTSLKT